jgi:hypothetical protein
LGNYFEYEMVYCESCGVNCFLVHKSELDEIPSCRGDFPHPTVHYPCYKVGNSTEVGHRLDTLGRKPVLVTHSLLSEYLSKTITGDELWQVMVDNTFLVREMSTAANVRDRKPGLNTAQVSHILPWYCAQIGTRQADDVKHPDDHLPIKYDSSICDCFCSKRGCENPQQLDDVVGQFQEAFRKFTSQSPSWNNMHTGPAQYGAFCNLVKNVDWSGDPMFRQLRNYQSDLCGAVASMHVKRVFHFLSINDLITASDIVQQGLRYNPTHSVLSALAQHFAMADELKSSMRTYAISQHVTVQRDNRNFIVVIGLSICEETFIVAKQVNKRWKLDAAGLELLHFKIYSSLRDAVFWGLTPEVFPRYTRPGLDENSRHNLDFIFSYVPACLRNVYSIENEVRAMCTRRDKTINVIIMGPMFSGVLHLHRALSKQLTGSSFSDSTNNRVRAINSNLIKAAGCSEPVSNTTSMLSCREELYQLSRGFFIEQSIIKQRMQSGGFGDDSKLDKSLFDDMYKLQLDLLEAANDVETSVNGDNTRTEAPSLQIISDEQFSFTSSMWKGPLGGKTILVLSVTPPSEVIRCIRSTSFKSELISNDEAVMMWWSYFRSSIEALTYYEATFVQEQWPGDQSAGISAALLGSIYANSGVSFNPVERDVEGDGAVFTTCPPSSDIEAAAIGDIYVPKRMLDCYDALLKSSPHIWSSECAY